MRILMRFWELLKKLGKLMRVFFKENRKKSIFLLLLLGNSFKTFCMNLVNIIKFVLL